MATVMLIITIPTELEELRKRQEQLSRRQDVEMSVDHSSHRSETIDNVGVGRPHIHEAVKKAMLLLNTSQQRIQSSVYPRASEIFFPKQENLEESDSRVDHEPDVLETSTGSPYYNEEESPKNEGSSKTTSHDELKEIFTSSNSKQKRQNSTLEPEVEISKNICLETVLRVVLKELGIDNAFWTQTSDGRMHQILFTISFDEAYEELLCELHEWGIGDRAGSTIAVLNCIASKKAVPESQSCFNHKEPAVSAKEPSMASNENCARNRSRNRSQSRYRKGVWERFMNSVRSRLNIAQIVRSVRQDAIIDFDFMTLLVSAALLSAFGLIEDNLVFLASSMLISPLMGPIIAAIFGTVIKDPALRNMGIRNECYGIMVSLVVGFFFGIFICAFDPRFKSMEDVTNEMIYRGTVHTLLMSSIAAIPSGAAVAIGILNGNMGSLIGVAISASLLPPAVNSGMLWAMALFCLTGQINRKGFGLREKLYSDDTVWDFIAMSGISMGITALNIVLVFVTGIILLKVKEVVPGIGGNNREFWKRDIKIARDLSKQDLSANAAIIEEYSNLPSEERKAMGINSDMLRCMHVPVLGCQHTWSPGHLNFESGTSLPSGYATVHRLEYLYSTITHEGFTEHFPSEMPDPRRIDETFEYFVCNERERNRDTCRQQGPTYRSETRSETNQSQAGLNRRFVITPVDKSDPDGDEFDV